MPSGVDDGPAFLSVGRIVGFYAHVEAQQEVVEVHAQPYAVGGRQFFIERFETEKSSGLVGIVTDCPDVSCIDEYGALKDPE